MQFRIPPENDFARIWLLRILTSLFTERQVIINRVVKRLHKVIHIIGFKCDPITEIKDLAVKDLCFLIEFEPGRVPSVFH